MAKQSRPNRSTGKSSFGKRQSADSDFRKKKKDDGAPRPNKGGKFRSTRGPGKTDERSGSGSGYSRGGSSSSGRSYGRSEGSGEKRSYGARRSSSESSGERRERPYSSRGRSEGGASRSYGKPRGDSERGGERKSYGSGSGERKSYGSGSGERRSYGKPRGDSERGERKSFGAGRPRGDSDRGERKSYGAGSGERRSYGKPRGDSERGGEKRPYTPRPRSGDADKGGDRSFSKPRGEGFGNRRSGGSSYEGGKRKFSSGDDSKKPYERKTRSFDKPKEESKGEGDFEKKKRAPRERKSFVESKVDESRERLDNAPAPEPTDKDGLIRLNKFISNSGVCSRREADELIKMGLVSVNGVTITEMGHKVKPTDDVRHEGKKLTAERPVYILLNKPKGFITTTEDPQERNTVMHLIAGACKERVYPVGRLDRNTTGLLLLTNDGDLTDKLTHPSFNAKKIYKVELDKPLTKDDFEKIKEGVRLDEGKAMVDDLAIVSDDGMTVGIELHIGWNHVVRRIFDTLQYAVVKLDRVVYAGLDKKDLKRGQWRFLRTDEIVRLKHFGS